MLVATDPLVLLEGARGTGKTLSVCWKSHLKCAAIPGYRVLWVRMTRRSMTDSVMVTYEREVLRSYNDAGYVLGRRDRGGRDRYPYRNGSEIVCGGFDNFEKFRSAEYHQMCFFQAEEMLLGPVEDMLGSNRDLSGRINDLQVIFDVNPGAPTHFLNQWGKTGKVRRLRSKHQDNPGLWDADLQCWTPAGEEYMSKLQRMSGARYKRLYLGEWYAEEGAIFDYEPERHLLTGRLTKTANDYWRVKAWDREVALTWFVVGVDWGSANPGAMVVLGFDQHHNAYVVEQYYKTGQTTEWWAGKAEEIWNKYRPLAFICDSAEKDRIAVFRDKLSAEEGRQVVAGAYKGNKSVITGIVELQEAFIANRLFILAGSLAHDPDRTLAEGASVCLQDEVVAAIWERDEKTGEVIDWPDDRRQRNALDALRYAFMWARRRQYDALETREQYMGSAPGTGAAVYAKRRVG